ncbi:winged helix-turn-helix transcriptional regulator [Methanococcoides sp. FTZ1]|uniref:winged helix-turn-helix transcriptional regulator n=1 Tax=Methanococcoides sp. FTZ1 TaxID=3439061 RepID=UPI003F871416
MKDCTIYKTIDIIGKRWTLCILLELYKGNNEEKRFNELKKKLQTITPKTLSVRLKELEEDGLVKRTLDDSKDPAIYTYSLTKSGMEFMEIIQSIKQWGLEWKFENKICGLSNCKNCKL